MAKQLHIIVMSPLYKNGGGIQTWLVYFLKGILEKDIYSKVYIYNIKPANYQDSISTLFKNKVECEFLDIDLKNSIGKGNGFKNILDYTIKTIKLMRGLVKNNDKIIIIGTIFTAPVGIISNFIFKKAIIATWIRSRTVGELAARKSKFIRIGNFLEKKLLNVSDIIIANGHDTLQYYKSIFPVHQKKMKVIENAVEYNKFSDLQIPNFRKNIISIAYLGRMVAAKGFSEYIKAANHLKSNSLSFSVHGHGGEIESDSIIYCGSYSPDDVTDVLSRHGIIVFLNKNNSAGGLSHGLLEAMASGRLIIAWDNPIHSQVLDKNNSILIEEGNEKDLIKAFESFTKLSDEDIASLEKKCLQVRKKAKDYSVEKHIDKFIAIMDKNSFDNK
ncbi:glycosyltransferase family 4 protein [Oceanobacillus profundus]|uniref:Glycosyltransferase n=1 Tax=Oceanobacillus profundus TaxID=372463 RepID=A0A417YCQ1_9BACI|nr:glycosyltransferase family 4 protein [Oceanobacillus profundus]RHW30394.1 glycosyltransferase [Oceanobacillus profundus]